MKNMIAAAFLFAGGLAPSAIEHTLSIVQRPDGQYDITCLDGVAEIKSKSEVLANHMCIHLRTFGGRWVLSEGGIDNGARFCDLDLNLIRSENAVVKLRAGFAPPCAPSTSESQQCQGLSCSLELNGRYFSFDFSVVGLMTMNRLDDNFSAVYRGNAGSGNGGGSGDARLAEVSGVPNILQTSNDNGQSFASVCDDNFGEEEAAVACRELGFSGHSQKFTAGVYAANDADFGWDDLTCRGGESSLADCGHTQWGRDNCDEAEHVQLVCDP